MPEEPMATVEVPIQTPEIGGSAIAQADRIIDGAKVGLRVPLNAAAVPLALGSLFMATACGGSEFDPREIIESYKPNNLQRQIFETAESRLGEFEAERGNPPWKRLRLGGKDDPSYVASFMTAEEYSDYMGFPGMAYPRPYRELSQAELSQISETNANMRRQQMDDFDRTAREFINDREIGSAPVGTQVKSGEYVRFYPAFDNNFSLPLIDNAQLLFPLNIDEAGGVEMSNTYGPELKILETNIKVHINHAQAGITDFDSETGKADPKKVVKMLEDRQFFRPGRVYLDYAQFRPGRVSRFGGKDWEADDVMELNTKMGDGRHLRITIRPGSRISAESTIEISVKRPHAFPK